MRAIQLAAVIFLSLASGGGAPGQALADSPLLEEVLQGNRTTLDSIHTFYCRMTIVEADFGQTAKPEQCGYWRSGSMVRARTTDPARRDVVDIFANDSRLQGLSSHADERHGYVNINTGRLPRGDAWEDGLLTFPLSGGATHRVLPIDRLLQEGQKIGNVTRREEDGHSCIVVELLDKDDGRRELWFEPKLNYLVWRVVFLGAHLKGQGGQRKMMNTVKQFTEIAPGMFFPADAELSSSRDGKPVRTISTTFSDIRINEPLPPDIFDFRFPADLRVYDRISGTSYITGADGNSRVDEKASRARVAPPVASAPGDFTRVEVRPWSSWIIPCSLGVLGGAAGLYARNRWLMRKTATTE